MDSSQTTPPRPPSKPAAAPDAPSKPTAAQAWASFVGGMGTMSEEAARRLDPTKDIGVHLGPVMDEAQFEAYRRARAGEGGVVRVLNRKP